LTPSSPATWQQEPISLRVLMMEVLIMKTRRSRSKPAQAKRMPPAFHAIGVPNVQIRNLLIRMLRPNEAMRILGINKSAFYRRVKAGLIKTIPLDGSVARKQVAA
jgi:predicted DNA-binding transcriptional regulator AlpA